MISLTTFAFILVGVAIIIVITAFLAWNYFFEEAIKKKIQASPYPMFLLLGRPPVAEVHTNLRPEDTIRFLKDMIGLLERAAEEETKSSKERG